MARSVLSSRRFTRPSPSWPSSSPKATFTRLASLDTSSPAWARDLLAALKALRAAMAKAANQPLLYRTLNLIMNPYIFIIARAYSSRIPLAHRRDNHEQYVRLVLKTPLDKIESEVERYFEGLYSRTFEQGPAFPGFAADDWAAEFGSA